MLRRWRNSCAERYGWRSQQRIHFHRYGGHHRHQLLRRWSGMEHLVILLMERSSEIACVGMTILTDTKWDVLNLTDRTITSYMLVIRCIHINVQSTIACFIGRFFVLVVDKRSICAWEIQVKICLCGPEESNSNGRSWSTNTIKNSLSCFLRWWFWSRFGWWFWVPVDPCEIAVSVSFDFIWNIITSFVQGIRGDIEYELNLHSIVCEVKLNTCWLYSFATANAVS